jgi:hypothetical protein
VPNESRCWFIAQVTTVFWLRACHSERGEESQIVRLSDAPGWRLDRKQTRSCTSACEMVRFAHHDLRRAVPRSGSVFPENLIHFRDASWRYSCDCSFRRSAPITRASGLSAVNGLLSFWLRACHSERSEESHIVRLSDAPGWRLDRKQTRSCTSACEMVDHSRFPALMPAT